jgi:excisionase family DNA binding protein
MSSPTVSLVPVRLRPRLTLDECAALARVTTRTIRTWIAAGKFPGPVTCSGRLRFDPEQVERALSAARPPVAS